MKLPSRRKNDASDPFRASRRYPVQPTLSRRYCENMRVALLTTFRTNRKETLAILLERIHQAFSGSGLDEPRVVFALRDSPVPVVESTVQQATKRFPELHWFRFTGRSVHGRPPALEISNAPGAPAAGRSLDFATLLEVARCVPRVLPFAGASFQFLTPAFGEELPAASPAWIKTPGIFVQDTWGIKQRGRQVMALTVVEADPTAKALPAPPAPVEQVLAVCGTAQDVSQFVLPGVTQNGAPALYDAGAVRRLTEIVSDFRQRLPEILEQAGLPHQLPSPAEALKQTPIGVLTGPKKPALTRAFKPLGYSCRGDSGAFTLRRRTSGNLIVEITLDVGKVSNSLTAWLEVHVMGGALRLPLPPATSCVGSHQYEIGDSDRWRKIVENLAALVQHLDRSFVPAIESESGPIPAWYSNT